MPNDLVIKRVKKFPLFDVFQGEGWDGWSRVLVKDYDEGRGVVVAGEHLPAATLKYVLKQVQEMVKPPSKPS